MPDTSLPRPQQADIDAHFRRIWALGANVVIGWRWRDEGIDALYLPSYDLPRVAQQFEKLLRLDRHIVSASQFDALIAAGCKVERIALAFKPTPGGDIASAVNAIVRNYTVGHVPCRAVALFDIVSFSLYSAFEQITQISVLSHYLKLAARRCQTLKMPVDLCLSTTGDGFYVWNRDEGLIADLALYNVVMLALGYTYAARARAETESVPRLRCAFHFGSHYEYHQGGGTSGDIFIVGDVTIELARIISQAQPNQLLIGAYRRDLMDEAPELRETLATSTLDTPAFMALAQSSVERLQGVPIPGGRVAGMKVYLTGPKLSKDSFAIHRYHVTDKHGLEHACYNARLTMISTSGERLRFGLLDRDLDAFGARRDASEDIVIRMDEG